MKFIYLTNGIYELNTLTDNINVINELNKKDNTANTQIIYGGNQSFPNSNISKENYTEFLKTIGLLNKNFIKNIMFGGLDFGNNVTNCSNLIDSIDFYKKDNNSKFIFNIDYKIVDGNLLLFLNNQINEIVPGSTIISNTCLKYLSELNQSKYNNDLTIDNLIGLQITELSEILKKNINIKSIIFISQSPLFVIDYQNNKIKNNYSMKLFEWINRYFYQLKYINKLHWICGDYNNRNETSTISIEKIDNENNLVGKLNINQYIVGTNFNLDNGELKKNIENMNETKEFEEQFEIGMGINIQNDIKSLFKIKYQIEKINQDYGFIEFEIGKKLSGSRFNFVNSKKIIVDKKSKIEGFKKVLKKQNKFNPSILDNIEISLSESNNPNNNIQITEEGDPYKEKYLKYKKKLQKLRNNK